MDNHITVIQDYPARLTVAFHNRAQSGFWFNNFAYIISQALQHSFAGAIGDNKGVCEVRNAGQVEEQNIFCEFFFKNVYDLAS